MKYTDKQMVVKGYDLIMSRIYDALTLVLLRPFSQRAQRVLLKEASPRQGASVLDIGCGTGSLLIEFAKNSHSGTLVGLDASKEMLRISLKKLRKKKLNGDIELIQADAENLPIRDEAFDVITLVGVLRFLPSPEKTLSDTATALRKGGRLVLREFAGPDQGVRCVYHPPTLLYRSFLVWRLRSDKVLAGLLAGAGLKDVSVYRSGLIPHFPLIMRGLFRRLVFARGSKPKS